MKEFDIYLYISSFLHGRFYVVVTVNFWRRALHPCGLTLNLTTHRAPLTSSVKVGATLVSYLLLIVFLVTMCKFPGVFTDTLLI